VIEDAPGYVLLLEHSQHRGLVTEIETRVQANLEGLNEEYASKCATGRLLPLRIREVPLGTWRKIRDARIRARGNVEEYKHSFLAQDAALVERLITGEQVMVNAAAGSNGHSQNAPHLPTERGSDLAASNSAVRFKN
jgi:hypothetical protein